ncbi:hypothetical protein CUJ83_01035 [Methanocella sp. CWC-04]|uniref:B box-type domain-containing protein n=1 Tax=Methanooceanicella nereidis TaxID=2052831 RepID=A0AAP2R9V8_9EURY|nr:hypothetical protein [Methanocella sp. CWC-04]MCD1293581.1 hypothetical protein [Methanocella sp. CWC-04]
MNCFYHPGLGAVATCTSCGKSLCSICKMEVEGKVLCRPCAAELTIKKAPEAAPVPEPEKAVKPEETTIKAPAPEPVKEPVEKAAPAPVQKPVEEVKKPEAPPAEKPPEKPAEKPVAEAPVKPSPAPEPIIPPKAEVKPTPPPSPAPAPVSAPTPAPKKKEPLLSLILSLILPGLGQIYNSHVKKGLVLLIIYMAVWAGVVPIILGGISQVCCCFPFIFALIVILYSAYEAYTTAEKLNKGEPVSDWFS